MSDPETVWIIEPCAWDMYGIDGVYESAAAAMSHHAGQWEWNGEEFLRGELDMAMDQGSLRLYEAEVSRSKQQEAS